MSITPLQVGVQLICVGRLVPRARNAAKEALKKLLPAAEKAVLNPSSMTDRDQRKENRDNAIKIVTGTEDKVSTNRRHPELQKVMDEARKNVFKPSNNK